MFYIPLSFAVQPVYKSVRIGLYRLKQEADLYKSKKHGLQNCLLYTFKIYTDKEVKSFVFITT